MANLRDADHTLTAAVATTIDQLETDTVDTAATKLAMHYAQAIDTEPDQLETLGPHLLKTLEALGATPTARAKLTKGGQTNGGPNRLGAIREARAG